MLKRLFKFSKCLTILALPVSYAELLNAEETIIQQEEMSFEKCVKVIDISAEKLSVLPAIMDLKEQMRTAVFEMSDGKLKIVCDGAKQKITVIVD